jgi:hypothetical protein
VRRLAVALVLVVVSALSCTSVDRVTSSLSPSAPPPTVTTGPTGAADTIVVDAPRPGDDVVSPLRISGVARTTSGSLIVEIVGHDGGQVAAARVRPTCGGDCRGPFSTELAFFVDRREEGSIRVFEVSAADGTALQSVDVPVTLVPSG